MWEKGTRMKTGSRSSIFLIDFLEVTKGTVESHGHHFPLPNSLRPAGFVERCAAALPEGSESFTLRGSLNNCRLQFERTGQ
jgi:hypothetical protein